MATKTTILNPSARYIARFTPEAWLNNYAVMVDAEGEQEWDATADVLAAGEDYWARIAASTRDDFTVGLLDNDDVLKDTDAAPAWVRAWQGPFTIEVREADQDA